MRQPRKRKRWPTMLSRNVAESQLHVLRHWRSSCQPWNKVAESQPIALLCWRRRLSPMSVVAKKEVERGVMLGETALAEERRRHEASMPAAVSTTRAKAVADEANKRHRQAKAAIGEQRRQAATA